MRSRLGFLTANPRRRGPSSQGPLRRVIVFLTDSPFLISPHADEYAHTKPHLNQDSAARPTSVIPPDVPASRPIGERGLMTAITEIINHFLQLFSLQMQIFLSIE